MPGCFRATETAPSDYTLTLHAPDGERLALDPQTLRTTLGCVLRRAPSLLVVAHP